MNSTFRDTKTQMQPGYVSDYYKNGQKRHPEMRIIEKRSSQPSAKPSDLNDSDREGGAPWQSQINGNNKLSSKKFFKSKIDFMAPIKSLQKKDQVEAANALSDDSDY